eukprot:328204_1
MIAPLPTAVNEFPANTIPIPPINTVTLSTYFANLSKGRKKANVLKLCFKKYGLSAIKDWLLPNKTCIFFWIQIMRFKDFNNVLSLSLNKLPCISLIPTQSILCEKTKLPLTLYKYYGNNAWNITPKTFHVCFDPIHKTWNITNLIQQHLSNGCTWITKMNIGHGGKNVFLFGGNCLKSLQTFLSNNYTTLMIKQINQGKRFNNLKEYEKYSKNNNFNGKDISLMSSVIFQKYIDNPLLFDNHYKTDLRIWVLVATTNPCVLFYKFIKQRICATEYHLYEYDKNQSGIQVSITNKSELHGHVSSSTQARAHKKFDPNTSTINGRPTLSDYNGFIKFIYDISINKKKFDIEWFETKKYKNRYNENKITLNDIEYLVDMKINNLLRLVYNSAKESFDEDNKKYNWKCQFLFHGIDIMVDENGKFFLLEVNIQPAMFTDHDENIKKICQNAVEEMIDIVMEIRQLQLNGYNVNQYTSLKTNKLWSKAYLDYKLDPPSIQIIDNIINDINIFLCNNSYE